MVNFVLPDRVLEILLCTNLSQQAFKKVYYKGTAASYWYGDMLALHEAESVAIENLLLLIVSLYSYRIC